ncbi:MAG: FAD-dependent oxidoreductase, partial [Candidatus Helarchaeota archaeon]
MSQEKKKKVIVIGSGIAGMNVIYGLMKFNDFDITCITREKQYAYSTCGIPYVLEGVVEKFEDIILHRPEFFDEKNVKILTNTTVIDIDYTNKQVKTFSKEGKVDQLEFDFLVIATGRVPFTPEIKGTGLKRIYTLMNYSNGVMLKEAMTQCEKAVIVGAGLIGLEAAVAFAANNIKTTVVELTPSVLPAMLDLDMGI